MGWVSMREDQIDAASEQLQVVRSQASELARTKRQKELLDRLLVDVEAVIEEARELVRLATDPEVDLARDVFDLRQEVGTLQTSMRQLKDHAEEVSVTAIAKEREVQRLTKQLTKARNFFAKAFGPERLEAYDTFMKSEQPRRRNKPDS